MIVPASSSSSMKVTPLAVAGRWRATTSPATCTRLPCRVPSSSALVAQAGRLMKLGGPQNVCMRLPLPRCRIARVRKRTNMNVDVELANEASQALGTRTTTETVDAAMRDVVRRARLKRLVGRDLRGLTPEALEAMREQRSAGDR